MIGCITCCITSVPSNVHFYHLMWFSAVFLEWLTAMSYHDWLPPLAAAKSRSSKLSMLSTITCQKLSDATSEGMRSHVFDSKVPSVDVIAMSNAKVSSFFIWTDNKDDIFIRAPLAPGCSDHSTIKCKSKFLEYSINEEQQKLFEPSLPVLNARTSFDEEACRTADIKWTTT